MTAPPGGTRPTNCWVWLDWSGAGRRTSTSGTSRWSRGPRLAVGAAASTWVVTFVSATESAPAARVSGRRLVGDEHAVARAARTAAAPARRGALVRAITTSELVVVRLLGVALLHEDKDVAPRILEPRRAQPDDVGDALGEELHTLGLELGPPGFEVVTHQPPVAP